MFQHYIEYLESMMKDLAHFEKKGLDTSSLRLFIKNLKTFQKLQKLDQARFSNTMSFEEKLAVIKSFLEDKTAFPRIKDIIEFSNEQLSLGFKDQKEARDVTIRRVIGRIKETPELKEKVKNAVINIRNQKIHTNKKRSVRDIESVESFSKWADILKNI